MGNANDWEIEVITLHWQVHCLLISLVLLGLPISSYAGFYSDSDINLPELYNVDIILL